MEKIKKKFKTIIVKKPLGIEFPDINLDELNNEFLKMDIHTQQISRFGNIFLELEGHKQWISQFYANNTDKIHVFKNAIFYNELIQIQVFFEFINSINVSEESYPNFYKIINLKNNLRLNKIRNSIAHFDWGIDNQKIKFKDNNFNIVYDYSQVSDFCSLLSILGFFIIKKTEEVE